MSHATANLQAENADSTVNFPDGRAIRDSLFARCPAETVDDVLSSLIADAAADADEADAIRPGDLLRSAFEAAELPEAMKLDRLIIDRQLPAAEARGPAWSLDGHAFAAVSLSAVDRIARELARRLDGCAGTRPRMGDSFVNLSRSIQALRAALADYLCDSSPGNLDGHAFYREASR